MRDVLSLLFLFFVVGVCEVSGTQIGNGGIDKLIKTVVDVIVSDKPNTDEYLAGNKKESSDGTGFIIDENGYIVTNCHVIDTTENIKIILHDGSEYAAKIIGKDDRSDIALLKIDADSKLLFVQFADSDKAEICDPVIAIGNPFGFGKTVTSGIISYKGRNLSNQIAELGVGGDLVSYMQTDASVNYGNSGGPLFLYNGEVVGMVTVFFSEGGHNTGINFAIPSNTLKKVINQLRNYGKMRRSWLGITVTPLSKKAAKALGLGKQLGCVINKVENNSPASVAGIQTGDILLSINDEKIFESTNLEYMLNNLIIGKVIPIQILRHNAGMKLSITVGSRSDDDFSVSMEGKEPIKKDIPYEKIDGIDVGITDLTKDIRKNFDIPDNINGVLVSYIGNLKNTDIAVGNVISMVNQINVSDSADLKLKIQNLLANEEIRNRGEIAFYVFDPQTKRSDYAVIDVYNTASGSSPKRDNLKKTDLKKENLVERLLDRLIKSI